LIFNECKRNAHKSAILYIVTISK